MQVVLFQIEVVVAQVTCKHAITTKPCPKNDYFFNQGDYNSLSFDLPAYLPEFACSYMTIDIEDLWQLFRNVLFAFIDKYVPPKMLSERCRNDKPWMDKNL